MAAGWLTAALSTAVALVYFTEIKDLTRGLIGLPAPSQATMASARPSGRFVESARASPAARGRIVELRAGAHGHYYATAEINGRSVDVLVDSGASIIALSWEDAQRAGLFIRDSDFTHRVSTANGIARVAPVTLDRVSIGDIMVRDVQAAVTEPGAMTKSLLGMSFLSRLQRIDIRSGVLILQD
jgi:aspartyl protease family protein